MMASKKKQAGITLIELIIASFLGLLVSAGLIQVLISSKSTSYMQTEVARLQENARFAIESLSRDLRNTDFWGCNEDLVRVTNHVTNTESSAYFNFENAISGLEGTNESIPDAITLIGATLIDETKLKPNTKISTKSAVGFTANNIDPKTLEGKAIIVADCLHSDIFQISSISGNKFIHNQTLTGDYADRAFFYTPFKVEYSIKNERLVRTKDDVEMTVASHVKNMQIYYGEDSNGNGLANHFVSQSDVMDFNAVVSVKVLLLFSTANESIAHQPQTNDFAKIIAYQKFDEMSAITAGTYEDRAIYFPFVFTIAIRNRLL